MTASVLDAPRLCGALLLSAALIGPAQAQNTATTTNANTSTQTPSTPSGVVAAFAGFGRWLAGLAQPSAPAVAASAPTSAPVNAPVTFALGAAAPASGGTATPYEPLPVIMGEPALPLLGDLTPQTRAWHSGLNYQGLQLQLQVLSRDGRSLQARPASHILKTGERFRFVVTPTFDGSLSIDRITGSGWVAQRGARIYPAAGTSTRVVAGEARTVPEGEHWFRVDQGEPTRFVLSVQQGDGTQRSDQPAYRQDGASATHYLQLVPPGKRAVIEQLFTPAR